MGNSPGNPSRPKSEEPVWPFSPRLPDPSLLQKRTPTQADAGGRGAGGVELWVEAHLLLPRGHEARQGRLVRVIGRGQQDEVKESAWLSPMRSPQRGLSRRKKRVGMDGIRCPDGAMVAPTPFSG